MEHLSATTRLRRMPPIRDRLPVCGFNNTLAAGSCQYPRFRSRLSLPSTDGWISSYNSLQVTVNRQVTHGLQPTATGGSGYEQSERPRCHNRKNDRPRSFDQPNRSRPMSPTNCHSQGTRPVRECDRCSTPWEAVLRRHHQLLQRHAAGFQRHQPDDRMERRKQPGNVAAGPLILDTSIKQRSNLMNPNDPNNMFLVTSAITDQALRTCWDQPARYIPGSRFCDQE